MQNIHISISRKETYFIYFNVEPQEHLPLEYLDKFGTRIILLKILDEIRALRGNS